MVGPICETGDFLALDRDMELALKSSEETGDVVEGLLKAATENKGTEIDYKNSELMRRFLSPEGKILPGRRTGLTSKNQRKITKAIKRARAVGLLPFTNHEA